jgi:predicted ATPase
VQYLLTQTLQQSSLFDLQVDENFCDLVMVHTLGNLYRIIEFLHWLEDHQLLTTNGNGSNKYTYWSWNMDEIYRAVKEHIQRRTTKDQTMNVQQLFYTSHIFDIVSIEMLEILKVGACFGNSCIDETMIQLVLDYPIHDSIVNAVERGILVHLHDDKESKLFAFVHENVQQYVYHRIPENEREQFHLEIGRRLWRGHVRDDLDQHIFVVLSQIRIGRRWITRWSERCKVAALCLHAGRKAAKLSSFRISLIYLKLGIEMLGDRGWREEYDLALMIYNATAEMEVSCANYEEMEDLVSKILQHSRCTNDTIQARTTQVYALCVSDRQHDGLNSGIQLMADLGYAFPTHFSLWTLLGEVRAVLALLKGKSDDYLKRLPLIDDATVLAAMHVLNMVSYSQALCISTSILHFGLRANVINVFSCIYTQS